MRDGARVVASDGMDRRGLLAMLVATDAAQCFARLDVRHAAHGLNGDAARIERLEKHDHARRHAEISRAVRLDRHGAEHAFARVVVGDADAGKFMVGCVLAGTATRRSDLISPRGTW